MKQPSIQDSAAETRLPASVVSAAVTAAVVGFGSSVAIVLAATRAVGATPLQSTVWVAALCIGISATSLLLSLRTRQPIITAWSTPGAALIAANAGDIGFAEALGAFAFAGLLMLLVALVRPFGRLVERIPGPLASAMLAGILVDYCLQVVGAAGEAPAFVLPLVLLFLIVRLRSPNLAIPLALGAGLAMALTQGHIAAECCTLAVPQFAVFVPAIELSALLGLGVPLFIVTLVSQNLAGVAVLAADGFRPSARASFATTGAASLLLVPFGAHGVSLAAITAAICTGPDCHADQGRRWLAGPVYALCYLLLAVFAGFFVELLLALPHVLITTVAGLALFGPLRGALASALSGDSRQLDAAALTFVVAASGVGFLGISAAIWGLGVGLLVLGLQALLRRPVADRPDG